MYINSDTSKPHYLRGTLRYKNKVSKNKERVSNTYLINSN